MLLKIVEAINGRLEVYLDGGVRSGSDVFKALALGARAVFLGRPIIWGLAYNVCTSHFPTLCTEKSPVSRGSGGEL